MVFKTAAAVAAVAVGANARQSEASLDESKPVLKSVLVDLK